MRPQAIGCGKYQRNNRLTQPLFSGPLYPDFQAGEEVFFYVGNVPYFDDMSFQ